MLEKAMAENLTGISLVWIGSQETAGSEDRKSVAHFMRQNGLLPEEVVARPIVTTLSTRKCTGPQWID